MKYLSLVFLIFKKNTYADIRIRLIDSASFQKPSEKLGFETSLENDKNRFYEK